MNNEVNKTKKIDMELLSINTAIHRIMENAKKYMTDKDYVKLCGTIHDSDFQDITIPSYDGIERTKPKEGRTDRTFEIQRTLGECWRSVEKETPQLIADYWNERQTDRDLEDYKDASEYLYFRVDWYVDEKDNKLKTRRFSD